MDSKIVTLLAAQLRKGELRDAQPWDVGAAVRSLVDSLGPGKVGLRVDEARAAARILNKKRHYDHTRLLGKAWTDCRGFDATVTKHHAQALIQLSALDTAEQLLIAGLVHVQADQASLQSQSELPEYEGLLARVEKQRFVATGDKDALARATDRYLHRYESDPSKPFWHGINAVALGFREEREGMHRHRSGTVTDWAAAIYKQVTKLYRKNPSDVWLAATASEASIALDKCDQAELWLYRFLHHPQVQPFDVESYERQVREIWGGNACGGGTCADRLAAILSRHVLRTQHRWSVASADVASLQSDPSVLEKNFLGESSFSLDMVKRMLAACESIGCVLNVSGERLGTGFLLRGSQLTQQFGDLPVFVTNAHVISDTVANAIRPDKAFVTFEVESAREGRQLQYKVAEVLFTSEPGDIGRPNADRLDVTIVRLKELRAGLQGLPAATALPLVDPKAKAFVVGHPRGSGLQISLHDSLLLDIDDDERLLHYRTPTDPGNSGSPVFNAQWEVIAVHHAGSAATPRLRGSGEYEANEGIALRAVQRRLNS